MWNMYLMAVNGIKTYFFCPEMQIKLNCDYTASTITVIYVKTKIKKCILDP